MPRDQLPNRDRRLCSASVMSALEQSENSDEQLRDHCIKRKQF